MSGDACPGRPGGCFGHRGGGARDAAPPPPSTQDTPTKNDPAPNAHGAALRNPHNLICPAAPSSCSKCLAPYPNQPTLAKAGWSVASSSEAAPRALTAVGTRVCTAAWPKSQEPRVREPMVGHTGHCFVSTVSSPVCLSPPASTWTSPHHTGRSPALVPVLPSNPSRPSSQWPPEGTHAHTSQVPGASAHSPPGLPPPLG